MKIVLTETQLKMLSESRRRKKRGPYVEPEQTFDIDDKKFDDEFYSREDEINYGVEDDERPEREEMNESHKMKEMKKLLHWAEKVEGCFLKEVKNGVMICPPSEVKQQCYTTHRSDSGVQDVLAAIGKWNGVKKKVAEEAYKLNITVSQMKIIMGPKINN
jgi:hypothetical protein